jgi:hypothetical protein
MDSIERRKALEAMKAKADQVLAERRQKQMAQQKMFNMGLDARKAMAMTAHAMRTLDQPDLRALRSMNNRPAEKLVLKKTKGMKKKTGRTNGISM